jgi:hypothetical protein
MNDAAAAALAALLTCKHERSSGALCVDCGAVRPPEGDGWVRPKALEALSHALAQALGEPAVTCTQEGCRNFPIVTFVWPGKKRTPACTDHALKLLQIAAALEMDPQSLDMRLVGAEDDNPLEAPETP